MGNRRNMNSKCKTPIALIVTLSLVLCTLIGLIIYLVVDSNKHHKHPHPSPHPSHPSHPHKKGHDVDKHGCNKSAGYTYCKKRKKCIRPWEENC